jgi:hypothetical protein
MSWSRSIGKVRCLLVASLVLGFGYAFQSDAAAMDPSAPDCSRNITPNVGSLNEYVDNKSALRSSSYLPLIGIDVVESRGNLGTGQQLRGLSVTSVDRSGPSDNAGIRAERVRPLRAATEVGMAILLVGATLAFPPAILGAPLVPAMESAKESDVIIAVDAVRTRNVGELQNSLREVTAGETIYLTIIRGGKREQLRVFAPAILDHHLPAPPARPE